MDKNILRKFAIESRQELLQKMDNKIKTYYINENFSKEQRGDVYVLSNENNSLRLTNEEYNKRELLRKRINELGLDKVIEEAAYTWFNRIIAIRYMEINDILPLTKKNESIGIRVLSSKDNTSDPEILKFTNLINPELDIEFNREKYGELKNENEKFKYVLLLVCKKLGKVIPQVFDGKTDYIDILIPDNLLNDTGFVTKVITEVPEENFSEVEIIGWLYQYYNQTEKDRVMSANKKYKKDEIPYVTQLFTPDWIVKYMVENSLGRYWVEHNKKSQLSKNWKYLIKDNLEKKDNEINPTDISIIDPCCGSGHILVYTFEVLYQIYVEAGYNKKDIPELILKNNIYGLDIDDRAGQLSILSVLLKARSYDKNIFNKDVVKNLNVMSIQEIGNIEEEVTEIFSDYDTREEALYLVEKFKDAKTIGSLLKIENKNYSLLENAVEQSDTIYEMEIKEELKQIIKIAKILSKKFNIVVTNPPYVNDSLMPSKLKEYTAANYKEGRKDLFACFIMRGIDMITEDGFNAMVTMQSWMFLASFQKFRKKLLNETVIKTLLYMDNMVMGIAFGTVATVFSKNCENKIGSYNEIKYSNIKDEKPIEFPIKENKNSLTTVDNFKKIKGLPIAFWISQNMLNIFANNPKLIEFGKPCTGLQTSDNKRFVRLWTEVPFEKIAFHTKTLNETKTNNKKWYPYNKGGLYRKWYGNNEYVVNWENDGKEIKEYNKYLNSTRESSIGIANTQYYFKRGITWTFISIDVGVRYFEEGYIFDVAGCSLFLDEKYLKYILGLMCSKLMNVFLQILNPTMNVQVGNICDIPVIYDKSKKEKIEKIVEECVFQAGRDWDSFETSWNFEIHPLIREKTVEAAYKEWEKTCNYRFNKLKEKEEELNKTFIEIYGLQDELTPEVEDRRISVRKANREREIKSLISYAVGCMFGRYSLDKTGVVCAGEKLDKNNYKTFKPVRDNIIPITDGNYLNNDIVDKFKEFIEAVYGKETLNENLEYIADTLGKRGTETSEDTIRRYFCNDFYNEHVKMYQKKPIYWLFDSGKKNGFKCLVYMHSFDENTVPKVRLDYLHRVQTIYENLLADINLKLTADLSMNDKKTMQKKQTDLNSKLQETKEYDEKIAHIANQKIEIDLDDGVTINYSKFADILAKIK